MGSPRAEQWVRCQVGEKVPESQRAACAGHLPAIRSFFRVSGGHGALGGCWEGCVGVPAPPCSPFLPSLSPHPAAPTFACARAHSWRC